jgi:hypothetical protein
MKRLSIFLIMTLISNVLYAQKKVQYLDTDFPDTIPKKYASNVISINGRFQESLTMSPDGSEHLFIQTLPTNWMQERILRVKRKSDKSTMLDTLNFGVNFSWIAEPMISNDNKKLFFLADNYGWYSNRTITGDWSVPIKIESITQREHFWYLKNLKTDMDDFAFNNFTKDSSIFATANYISFKKAIQPGCDPYISRNGDYMIFSSFKPGGYGQGDLCICFNDGNGNWSEAVNLGAQINTEYFEYGPFISPDEQFLFFSRREKWENAAFSDIYWVSLKVIDKYRKNRKLK